MTIIAPEDDLSSDERGKIDEDLRRIAIVTDAWLPQINGVVRTLSALRDELERLGHIVTLITPDQFRTVPMPTYPEIRLSLASPKRVGMLLDRAAPDAIHIATEGPLGQAARRWCLRQGIAFTTAFHTKFPEYIRARFGIPERLIYALLRRFHGKAAATMVASQSLADTLTLHGFKNLRRWSRGVDLRQFGTVSGEARMLTLAHPIFLYVGRVAIEKNLEAFLTLDLPGTKLVVGDGPQREELQQRFPLTMFTGKLYGEELAGHYAMSDVFVFPSLTDTFGVVMLEAMAAGLPVAAFPVCGPLDVIGDSGCGVLSQDLRQAALDALDIDPARCRAYAATFTWARSARQFLGNLHWRAGAETPLVP